MAWTVTLANAAKTEIEVSVIATDDADAKMRAEVRANYESMKKIIPQKGPWRAVSATEGGSIYGSAETPSDQRKIDAEIEEIERKLNET